MYHHILLRRVIKKSKRFFHSLLMYIHLQLFLTLCSWPILLAWGLPLSYASIVGNFIFTPFLMLFLLVSSLIFFCELLYIPNTLLIYILEWITKAWTALLTLSDRSWLFWCPLPSKIAVLLLPLVACLILHHKKIISPIKNSFALVMLLLVSCITFKLSTLNYNGIFTLEYCSKELTIIQSHSQAILIDPGIFGRKISALSWARYTLIPNLCRQGVVELSIICTHLTPLAFQTLTILIDSLEVKHIYLPCWQGNLKNRAWSSWEKLLEAAKKYGTQIHLVAGPDAITLGPNCLRLQCNNKMTKKNNMSYYSLIIKY